MVNIPVPIAVFVIITVLAFIGLIHLIIYIILTIEAIIGYRINKKAEKNENNCPYFIEGEHND